MFPALGITRFEEEAIYNAQVRKVKDQERRVGNLSAIEDAQDRSNDQQQVELGGEVSIQDNVLPIIIRTLPAEKQPGDEADHRYHKEIENTGIFIKEVIAVDQYLIEQGRLDGHGGALTMTGQVVIGEMNDKRADGCQDQHIGQWLEMLYPLARHVFLHSGGRPDDQFLHRKENALVDV